MPPDADAIKIDEKYLVEWVEFGWTELVSYLTKHARFDAWCLEHPPEGEPEYG